MLYYVEDVNTDEIIDVVIDDLDRAIRICNNHPDSQVTTAADEVLYTFCLPF